jgi:hypothetical protein
LGRSGRRARHGTMAATSGSRRSQTGRRGRHGRYAHPFDGDSKVGGTTADSLGGRQISSWRRAEVITLSAAMAIRVGGGENGRMRRRRAAVRCTDLSGEEGEDLVEVLTLGEKGEFGAVVGFRRTLAKFSLANGKIFWTPSPSAYPFARPSSG